MDQELAATLEYITKDSVYFQECVDRRVNRMFEERAQKLAEERAQKLAEELLKERAPKQLESRISAIAKKLLSKGLPPEDIAEGTGLPLELVLQL